MKSKLSRILLVLDIFLIILVLIFFAIEIFNYFSFDKLIQIKETNIFLLYILIYLGVIINSLLGLSIITFALLVVFLVDFLPALIINLLGLLTSGSIAFLISKKISHTKIANNHFLYKFHFSFITKIEDKLKKNFKKTPFRTFTMAEILNFIVPCYIIGFKNYLPYTKFILYFSIITFVQIIIIIFFGEVIKSNPIYFGTICLISVLLYINIKTFKHYYNHNKI